MITPLTRRLAVILALSVLSFALVGLIYGSLRAGQHTASAALILHEPTWTGAAGAATAARPDRFVADQVAVLESRMMAARLADLLVEQDPESALTIETIIDGRRIMADSASSDLIVLEFTADAPELAIRAVDGLVSVYRSWREEGVAERLDGATKVLDDQIAAAEAQLALLERQQRNVDLNDPVLAAASERITETVEELGGVLDRLRSQTDPGQATLLTAEVAALQAEIDALNMVRTVGSGASPEMAAINRQIGIVVDEIGTLSGQRNRLVFEASLDIASPFDASEAELDPGRFPGLLQVIGISAIVGLVFGTGAAIVFRSLGRAVEHVWEAGGTFGIRRQPHA